MVIPVRVIWPSGKMQTSSPLSSALPASRKASRIILGPPMAGDRDRPHGAEEPAHERPLEVLGIDDEPDRPIDRAAITNSPSANETWFGVSRARAFGRARCSGPATRSR